MKWDSAAEGIGLILLSLGMGYALHQFFYNLEEPHIDTKCIVASLLWEPPEDPRIESKKYQDALHVELKFLFHESEIEEKAVYTSKCETFENCKKELGYHIGDEIECYYERDRPRTISLRLGSWCFGKLRTFFFLLILFCLCIPCCFVGGIVLTYVGIYEVKMDSFTTIRCDNTAFVSEETLFSTLEEQSPDKEL